MVFKATDRIVQSYVIVILAGNLTFEDVPKLFNLQDAVSEALKGGK